MARASQGASLSIGVPPATRRPVIGVVCAESDDPSAATDAERAALREVGQWAAAVGAHIVAVSAGPLAQEALQAFVRVIGRPGRALGVLTHAETIARHDARPRPHDLTIVTHLAQDSADQARVAVLTADAVVVLPSAVAAPPRALELAFEYARPIALYAPHGCPQQNQAPLSLAAREELEAARAADAAEAAAALAELDELAEGVEEPHDASPRAAAAADDEPPEAAAALAAEHIDSAAARAAEGAARDLDLGAAVGAARDLDLGAAVGATEVSEWADAEEGGEDGEGAGTTVTTVTSGLGGEGAEAPPGGGMRTPPSRSDSSAAASDASGDARGGCASAAAAAAAGRWGGGGRGVGLGATADADDVAGTWPGGRGGLDGGGAAAPPPPPRRGLSALDADALHSASFVSATDALHSASFVSAASGCSALSQLSCARSLAWGEGGGGGRYDRYDRYERYDRYGRPAGGGYGSASSAAPGARRPPPRRSRSLPAALGAAFAPGPRREPPDLLELPRARTAARLSALLLGDRGGVDVAESCARLRAEAVLAAERDDGAGPQTAQYANETGAVRMPAVGVGGSSERRHAEQAEPLGAWLAQCGWHLLTGGGSGVMASVAIGYARGGRGMSNSPGLSVGVLRAHSAAEPQLTRPGYPNEWVGLPVRTPLPAAGGSAGRADGSRHHLTVLSSDVLVILPGGPSAHAELALAKRYGRPACVFAPHGSALVGALRADGCGVPLCTTLPDVRNFCLSALPAWLKPRPRPPSLRALMGAALAAHRLGAEPAAALARARTAGAGGGAGGGAAACAGGGGAEGGADTDGGAARPPHATTLSRGCASALPSLASLAPAELWAKAAAAVDYALGHAAAPGYGAAAPPPGYGAAAAAASAAGAAEAEAAQPGGAPPGTAAAGWARPPRPAAASAGRPVTSSAAAAAGGGARAGGGLVPRCAADDAPPTDAADCAVCSPGRTLPALRAADRAGVGHPPPPRSSSTSSLAGTHPAALAPGLLASSGRQGAFSQEQRSGGVGSSELGGGEQTGARLQAAPARAAPGERPGSAAAARAAAAAEVQLAAAVAATVAAASAATDLPSPPPGAAGAPPRHARGAADAAEATGNGAASAAPCGAPSPIPPPPRPQPHGARLEPLGGAAAAGAQPSEAQLARLAPAAPPRAAATTSGAAALAPLPRRGASCGVLLLGGSRGGATSLGSSRSYSGHSQQDGGGGSSSGHSAAAGGGGDHLVAPRGRHAAAAAAAARGGRGEGTYIPRPTVPRTPVPIDKRAPIPPARVGSVGGGSGPRALRRRESAPPAPVAVRAPDAGMAASS